MAGWPACALLLGLAAGQLRDSIAPESWTERPIGNHWVEPALPAAGCRATRDSGPADSFPVGWMSSLVLDGSATVDDWTRVFCKRAYGGSPGHRRRSKLRAEIQREVAGDPQLRARLGRYPGTGQLVELLAGKLAPLEPGNKHEHNDAAKMTPERCAAAGLALLLRYGLGALGALESSSAVERHRGEIVAALRDRAPLRVLRRLLLGRDVQQLVAAAAPCVVEVEEASEKAGIGGLLARQADRVTGGSIRLLTGQMMPMVGLGTGYGDCGVEACSNSTLPPASFYAQAIRAGMRAIDTAALYGSERGIGEGLRQTGLAREELFITSKALSPFYSGKVSPESADLPGRLQLLGLEYVDAYLSHDHGGATSSEWSQLEAVKAEGLARALGTSWSVLPDKGSSNIQPGMALTQTRLAPCGVDIDRKDVDRLLRTGVTIVIVDLFIACRRDPVVGQIAARRGASPEQVLLYWARQVGLPVLISTRNITHLEANLEYSTARQEFLLSRFEMRLLESVVHFYADNEYNFSARAASEILEDVVADVFRVRTVRTSTTSNDRHPP